MELSAANRLKRTSPTARTTGKAESTPAAKSPSVQQHRADRLALSQQALSFLEDYNRQVAEKARQEAERKGSGEEELLEFLRKSSKMMDKCNQIAARVRAGDRVPPEDLQYLQNKDPDGYKLAIAMRKPKQDPKEYKSILDDEDKQSMYDGTTVKTNATAGNS